MKKEEVLKMTLGQLGFHTNTRNRLIDNVVRRWDHLNDTNLCHELHYVAGDTFEPRPQKKILASYCVWAEKITVAEVMEAVCNNGGTFLKGSSETAFGKKVEQLGLTKEDWSCLPKRTLKSAISGDENKAGLLQKNILALGTVSNIFLKKIKYFLKYELVERGEYKGCDFSEMEITIEKFITLYNPDRHEELLPSAKKTREKLVSLGFRYEDGIFMQLNTKRRFVELLMKEDGLSKRDATLVIETCGQRYGWGVRWLYEE